MTIRGIEVNPDKFQKFITMRSHTIVKEVHKITSNLAFLSHFLFYAGDKAFLFFASLKNNNIFEWTIE